MITRFIGTNISSKDPARLVKFYRDTLGIPVRGGESGGDVDGAELAFTADGPSIIVWDENRWGPSSRGSVNFVFGCDNLDRTYDELLRKGVDLNPPVTAAWGGKELMVTDPDGNLLLLLE